MIGRLPSTRKMFKLNCKAIHIYREKGVPITADTVHPNIMIFLTSLISYQGDLMRPSLSSTGVVAMSLPPSSSLLPGDGSTFYNLVHRDTLPTLELLSAWPADACKSAP
jgi:hypothetical protein